MLSRVAENLYWLSRYLERAENTVRLIEVHGNQLMDMPDVNEHDGWMPLISISGQDELFFEHFATATESNVTLFLLTDHRNPGSLINVMASVRYNLRSSRDILPKRLYESISKACRQVRTEVKTGIPAGQRQAFLHKVEEQLLAITGRIHSTLSHDPAYLFMQIGCFLERADMTSRVLDVRSAIQADHYNGSDLLPFENREWVSILRSVSAFQMYRQHIRRPINGSDCLAFLLTDCHLPRACRFCLDSLDNCLLPMHNNEKPRAAVAALQQLINCADVPALAANAARLHQFIDLLQIGLLHTGDTIATCYFPPRQDSK